MTREEFFIWLNDCPTHKWEIINDSTEHIALTFPVQENEPEQTDDD